MAQTKVAAARRRAQQSLHFDPLYHRVCKLVVLGAGSREPGWRRILLDAYVPKIEDDEQAVNLLLYFDKVARERYKTATSGQTPWVVWVTLYESRELRNQGVSCGSSRWVSPDCPDYLRPFKDDYFRHCIHDLDVSL